MTSDLRQDLINAARQFYQLGWMVGTAGNLSAKLEDGSFWITASGKSKGQLQENDFVRVSPQGEVLESPHPQNRPSAETSIHQAIYSLFPQANACYHVHSVEANLVSRFTEGEILPLPPLEMLKGLGVWKENPEVVMPVFKNYLEVPRIAQEISERFSATPPDVPALLIVYHGVTVWAESTEKAQHYIELTEYIFRYIVASHQLSL
ncbi:methylthioribulose 1-phosphate dehydratase [Gloeothece verrucosa]|uniref:Methylthioribulose-1-phosphate dehydratase n=1 Tax=Gloeothece verrucosa (strain PCC 7822) TaxID=497965 RepID=E0UI50_GLOV7|nr:methylthioribulose 1-phosphate dehydratase [Gloeothece verrucosa]ADN15702.1 methylthioribulose-1-phosphate dehydratase [Gloeothece verrucosa PCC 7822]